jgi:hypothetical protein
MKINWTLLILVLTVVNCSSDNTQEINEKQVVEGLFSRYLKETFNNDFKEKEYFVIIGKRICHVCEDGTLNAFRLQQNKIISDKITLITDFKKEDIDTLLNETFDPNIIRDSTSNFENYMFPRSYITIYKIVDGEVDKYAYFSEDKKLNQFLGEERSKKVKSQQTKKAPPKIEGADW